MDPLSISASIVALIGAAASVAKGLDKLQALRHAPLELKVLLNEVADLQVVLTGVNESLESLRGLGPSIPQDALRYLPNMVDRATKTISDLSTFVSGDLLKGDVVLEGSLPKVSRRAWLGKDKKLATFRSSIKDCKENLNVVLLSSTSRIIPHMLLSIQEVMVIDRDRLVRSTEALEQMVERFSAHPAFIQDIIESDDLDVTPDDDVLPTSPTSLIASSSDTFSDSRNTYLRIKTSINNNYRCERYCNCQCHVQSHISTPRWLQGLVGTLFYSYAGTPILNTQKCSSYRCRRSMVSSKQLCYYFPTWMIRKALIFTSTWRDVTGSGASWSIRVPRVFSNTHPAVGSIVAGNLLNLQRMIATREVSPFDVDQKGQSLLYWAEVYWREDMFAYLVATGADLNLKNNYGQSAVDRVWVKRFISKRNTAHNSQVPNFDEDSRFQLSPIHKIILGLTEASLEHQLELDSSHLESMDWQGNTPLLWAALRGDRNHLKVLLENGANFLAKDVQGKTALHYAAVSGHAECVKILLEHGADIEVCDSFGNTTLHAAVIFKGQECSSIIELLCRRGADLEARDILGWTPLHEAADRDNTAAISSLVAWRANVNALDSNGWLAIGHAITRGHINSMKTLCRNGAALNWNRTKADGNVLAMAAVTGSIQTMKVLSTMDPGKRIVYNPNNLYNWFENVRADYYIGPEEDPAELLAAFENLLACLGTPNYNMQYSDEDYPSEDEYMSDSNEDQESNGGWETVSDFGSDDEMASNEDVEIEEDEGSDEDAETDGESTTEGFQDAVEVQDVTDLMAGATLSDPVLRLKGGEAGAEAVS